jgi:hypothetical protein
MNTTQLLLEAKGHLDHPEDLIFMDGAQGGARAIAALSDTVKNPQAVTIKWDGYPALIFGRNSAGQFSIMDKHMFNKADGSGRQVFSPQEFEAYDAARGAGHRSDLHWIISAIWPALEKASKGTKGYYWGDFLFSEPLEEQDGVYTFRANPNGITYKVAADSELGHLIANKPAAVAVHQYLAPNAATTDDAISLDGTIGKLKNNTPVAIVPSAMPVAATLKLPREDFSKLTTAIKRYGPEITDFIENAPQSKNAFTQHFTTFINKQIVANDLNNLSDKFIPYMQQRKMTDSMRNKLMPYFQQNLPTIKRAFAIWSMIYNLKMKLYAQMNKTLKNSPVKGYLDDGSETQEGFVSQNIKFVDRLGFSRQNLAAMSPKPTAAVAITPEGAARNIVVVFGGGFQPWCPWHTYSFDQGVKALGKTPGARFYIGTSNDTKERPIPFNQKEILIRQAGIPDSVPVERVTTPFKSSEILKNFDPDRDVFVLVRSEKDPVPYTKKDGSPGYYQPLDSLQNIQDAKPFNPAGGHGYILPTKVKSFNVAGKMVDSASDIRAMYAAADDQGKQRIIHDMYPRATDPQMVKKILDKYLGAVQLAEADLPPDSSPNSPIPGTPTSLQPKPSRAALLRHKKQLAAIKRLIGH